MPFSETNHLCGTIFASSGKSFLPTGVKTWYLNHHIISYCSAEDTPSTLPEESLILTNFPFPARLARNTLKEDPLHTKRNTESLMQLKAKKVFN